MAESTVCQYHLHGHCKFGTLCRKKHETETCSNFPCIQDTCSKRHPKVCRYFALLGICKFKDECSYLHLTPSTTRMNELEIEIERLRSIITSISAEVMGINAKAAALETHTQSCSQSRIPQVDGQFDPNLSSFKCKRCNSTFDLIETYTQHTICHVMEENGITRERILALDTRIQEVHDTNYILLHSVDDLENDMKVLKINTNCQTFLFRCDNCGENFEKKSYWREHMRTHH